MILVSCSYDVFIRVGQLCCSSVSSWTTRENDLTLSADFEFVGVSPGEPGSPGSVESQEGRSRCRNERPEINGRACCVRYACTTSEYWTVDTRFFFCSFTLGVVSNRHHIRSWLMVFQSKWKDSSAGDTPSLTLIDTVEPPTVLSLPTW